MRKRIQDEFTDLPISRQRKYQLRMQQQKRCTECGETRWSLFPGSLEHALEAPCEICGGETVVERRRREMSDRIAGGAGEPHGLAAR